MWYKRSSNSTKEGQMAESTASTENHCGTCTLCCKVMSIDDMPNGEPVKKVGVTCHYLAEGACSGCTIYDNKPKSCSEYMCMWLGAKVLINDPGNPLVELLSDPELRPDKCHAVINPGPDGSIGVAVDQDYPLAWQAPALNRALLTLVRNRFIVVLEIGLHNLFMLNRDGSLTKMVAIESIPGVGYHMVPEADAALAKAAKMLKQGTAPAPGA